MTVFVLLIAGLTASPHHEPAKPARTEHAKTAAASTHPSSLHAPDTSKTAPMPISDHHGTDSVAGAPAAEHGHSPAKASAPPVPRRAKDRLCGELPSRKTTWKARQGPLHLAGTVIVGEGASLLLQAGTQVLVGAIDSCPDPLAPAGERGITLVVRGGTLRLEGSPAKPIVVRPESVGKGFSWNGIRIELARSERDAFLRWTEIVGASKGIAFVSGGGRVEHAVIDACGIGIASLNGASPSVSHSVIHGSSVADVVSSRSALRIVSSLFLDGRGDGIRFDGVGLSEVRTSAFWGHRGTPVVRGPTGLGDWVGDSLPDRFGNWNADPVLRDSPSHLVRARRAQDSLAKLPWFRPRRPPPPPPGSGRWALSPFSPLIDRGESHLCSDSDGSRCDIGLWGGP